MSQTNKPKSKTLSKEDRALLLVEIIKDLTAVEEEGYGRIVVEVQNHQIVTWWKVNSQTARGIRAKIKGIPPEA